MICMHHLYFRSRINLDIDPKMKFVSLQVNIWHCPILLVLDDHGRDSELQEESRIYAVNQKKTRHHPKEVKPEPPPPPPKKGHCRLSGTHSNSRHGSQWIWANNSTSFHARDNILKLHKLLFLEKPGLHFPLNSIFNSLAILQP